MSRNLLRRFDQFRRRHTAGFNAWLYGLLGRDKFLCNERLTPEQVKRILVLRNNKRIGNMYFLLPFLSAVRQTYPHADIDLMVIAPSQAKVFEGMSLANIWVSHFAFVSALPLLKTIFKCRQVPYDLLLMPHPSSTDIILGGLIHARNKTSFADPKTSQVYPHSITVDQASPHAALTPLALLEPFATAKLSVNHLMTFSPDELESAQRERSTLCHDDQLCVAYFRGARGNKIIADEAWLAIRTKFDANSPRSIAWVEILSPDITAPLVAGTTTWQSADFRKLGAFLAACDLFICGDTGPLHLADAAGARCVGIFTATSPKHYGCMGKQCWNITDIDDIDAAAIMARIVTRANDQTMGMLAAS